MCKKPKTISKLIHHSMVDAKIIPSSNGVPKQGEHQENKNEKDRLMQDAIPFGNKDLRPNSGIKKDKNGYKGQNPLTPNVMETYCKENQHFHCGEQGHNYCDCPKKKNHKDTPRRLNGDSRAANRQYSLKSGGYVVSKASLGPELVESMIPLCLEEDTK